MCSYSLIGTTVPSQSYDEIVTQNILSMKIIYFHVLQVVLIMLKLIGQVTIL
jgi:hypothetical protein